MWIPLPIKIASRLAVLAGRYQLLKKRVRLPKEGQEDIVHIGDQVFLIQRATDSDVERINSGIIVMD
jgi:hypothetical protein